MQCIRNMNSTIKYLLDFYITILYILYLFIRCVIYIILLVLYLIYQQCFQASNHMNSIFISSHNFNSPLNLQLPGTLAGLVAMSPGMQVTPRSIPCPEHSFGHGNISNLAVSFFYLHGNPHSQVDITKYPMKTKFIFFFQLVYSHFVFCYSF